MLLLVGVMGIGMQSRWRSTTVAELVKQLWLPAIVSVLAGLGFQWLYAGEFSFTVAGVMMLVFWTVFSGLRDIQNKIANKASAVKGLKGLSRSYYGMIFAHVGIVVTIVGAVMVSVYNEERDLRMAPGDVLTFNHYQFVFDGADQVSGPNYSSDRGRIRVLKDGQPYGEMLPEKRLYTARGNVMTEAAIDPGLFRDLYVAMGESLGDGAWAIRIQYKPFVRWLWLGGLLMTFGGLLAATDPRYRKQARREAARAAA
jgi:cytochrome c-type biogenesis protein CcmF